MTVKHPTETMPGDFEGELPASTDPDLWEGVDIPGETKFRRDNMRKIADNGPDGVIEGWEDVAAVMDKPPRPTLRLLDGRQDHD